MNTRREFLAEVGKGMLIAGVGTGLASELGIGTAWADQEDGDLSFGALEPLVILMQDTPIERLQPLLVDRLRAGSDLRTLITAGALANARSFGGDHYVGYHTLMALMPAYRMAAGLGPERSALPVLKVLYRNTDTIQQNGGRRSEVLRAVHGLHDAADGQALRERVRACDLAGAERIFAALAQGPTEKAYNELQYIVQDDTDVHRVVLAWRAWDTLQLAGPTHAHTLLRQSVRHCVDVEQNRTDSGRSEPQIRNVLSRLLDHYRLWNPPQHVRTVDDAWVESFSNTVFSSHGEQAADAAAAALAEGVPPEVLGEAVSLAATRLVLHDPGRQQAASMGRDVGSVHGASAGVHACDAANAWRHIARVTDSRHVPASLIVAAYHTAGQQYHLGDKPFQSELQDSARIVADPVELLARIETAIRDKNQAAVCGLTERYGALDHPVQPLFDLLLNYAISEDGALHAEKFYNTVVEEFASTRPAFRWRHVVALARVTASEYGFPAPGRDQARSLLNV